jgi:hypothetical protein
LCFLQPLLHESLVLGGLGVPFSIPFGTVSGVGFLIPFFRHPGSMLLHLGTLWEPRGHHFGDFDGPLFRVDFMLACWGAQG